MKFRFSIRTILITVAIVGGIIALDKLRIWYVVSTWDGYGERLANISYPLSDEDSQFLTSLKLQTIQDAFSADSFSHHFELGVKIHIGQHGDRMGPGGIRTTTKVIYRPYPWSEYQLESREYVRIDVVG
jgi:hypothetical protein